MSRPFDTHFTVLGILHLVFGVLSLLGGLAGLAMIGLGGALVTGLAAAATEAAGFLAGGAMGFIFLVALAVAALVSVPQIAAGIGLLKRKPWAPAVALFVSFFHLFTPPIGTVLAVYTGWAMLSERGHRSYNLLTD